VFRVALAVLGNVEDAEEAMQDTFIKPYRHLDHFRGESRFTTWLTRIAVNEALQKRQARKESVSLDEAPDVESKSLSGRFEPWTSNSGRCPPHRILAEVAHPERRESETQSPQPRREVAPELVALTVIARRQPHALTRH
jgi:RNA polymerase sigma-70 factor (ECF subfamily)